jgi:AcrR family transcriptional regulator
MRTKARLSPRAEGFSSGATLAGPGSGAAAENPDRKAAILLAAERLFAQRGYHAVSIREIAEAAGVPLALVGYHYGPKHELFHAIFAHWNDTIEQRLKQLAVAREAPRSARLEAIVRAFVEPVLRLRASEEGESYALLVARELLYSSQEADRALREFFDPLAHAFIDALNAVLPAATRAEVAWCYQFALGALIHHLSDTRVSRLARHPRLRSTPAAAQLLVNFIVGGIRSALPMSKKKPPLRTTQAKTRRPP